VREGAESESVGARVREVGGRRRLPAIRAEKRIAIMVRERGFVEFGVVCWTGSLRVRCFVSPYPDWKDMSALRAADSGIRV
jgi:hypothetical protein